MKIRPACAAALLAALAGCLAAAAVLQDGPRERGEDALRDRDYARAAALLAEALATAKDGKDEILYLLAAAQARGGKPDEALATLDRLLQEHPASPLRRKAAFKRGDVLAARKDFAAALAIYDDGLKAIVDPARRKALAGVFVETAGELLAPKDPKDSAFKPDYVAALHLLQRALDLEALEGDAEAAVRADVVRCHANGAVPGDLLAACLAFEEKFPRAARLDEVLFAKGVALVAAGRVDHAEKAWISVADRFPASPKAPEALLRAAAMREPRLGREPLRVALRLLRRAAKDYAATPEGPRAATALADALSSDPDLREEARAAYRAVVDGFPKDERAPQALLRISDLHANDGDDAKAIETLDDILKRYPDSPLWPQARQRIADLRFDRLRRARLRKDWPGLRTVAQEFADAHAADARVGEALVDRAAAFREEKKFREAADEYLRIAAKFPDAELGQRARFDAASTLALDLGEIEAALKELDRVKASQAGPAAALGHRLRDPSLALASERVFTSADAPAASLTVRNVETVRFRLWTLDLRDYFDKKSSTSGLQDLEVAVIAPDLEWELKVPGYVRHKEFKLPVPLPKKEPGAYVVLASAGALEAKTVVLVSDLALVARAGRQGATVLVQNQRTGERVANPASLVAADGKALKAWTPDTTASRLSFLTSDQGHAAFRDLDVRNLPVPPRRAAAALIIPDRRVVRADEDVRVRIWIRDAAGNTYVPPKDKAYRLVAARENGPAFWDVDVTPSALGAASAAFRPPPGASGSIRLNLYDRAKPREALLGQATVIVGAEPARVPRVDFLLSDAPVFVGEDVDVPCVLRDEWGRPVPGRRVEVTTDADLVPRPVVTGPDGTFLISFRETAIFGREGVLQASVAHGNRSDDLTMAVFSRTPVPAFEASSRFGEPLAAGEARAIAFTAKTADGAAVAGPFRWSVARLDDAGIFLALAAGDVVTDAQGRASFTFTPKERGTHVVKVLAKDADGVPARAEESLEVFDDGEERKVRILSAADEVEPGAPFEVTVLSRLEKGLAFVTVEGETVEQVLPVALEKGRTTVKLGPPPGKSRDFTVAVLVMRDGKFHADLRPFLLKTPVVRIEPARKSVRPGEEIAVKVTGRPGAELLFVATEELATNPGPLGFVERRPAEYFLGDSSVETSFVGVTRELDAQVMHAMARLNALESSASGRVMMPVDLPQLVEGRGGGGGGQFGSRMGGKRNLVARGGGGGTGKVMVPGAPDIDPAPLVFAAATIGADGTATFTLRAPPRHGEVALAAWTLDGANLIGRALETLKVRADVTAEIRGPESAVEGEKSSIVVLLTNRSGEEREAVVALNGAETRVKVPARSTVERALEWTAAETATVSLDGLSRELRTSIRPRPSTWTEAGGAFAARTELTLEGEGKTIVRYATSPQALLEALAAGDGSASGRAAALIARLARQRIAPSDAARLAVMEFAAWPGAPDEAREDEAWPVLAYLAAAEAKADGFEIEPDAAPLKERFARAAHDDVKALQLFALARGGETQYGYLHRLWRNPDALSPRALACVALALKSLGRPDEAKDAAARLAKRVKEDHWDAAEIAAADLSNTTYAATALAALALAEIDPANAALPRARAWLLARAPSGPFERAALAMALRSTPDRSAVTALRIGGREVTGAGEIAVDAVVVEPVGQGTYYVLARRATGRAPEPPAGVTVKRTIGWPGLLVEGRPIQARSTTDAGPAAPMTRVAAGQGFQIHYEVTLKGPLPGYRVVELDRVAGLRSARPRLLVAPTAADPVKIIHVVYAYADLPGPSPVLEILPAGADFRAGWTPSPYERLQIGQILFGAKKWKEARDVLLPIFDAPSVLDPFLVPAARMLAFAAAELGENETVVRFFEVLKEKAPEEVIPFDKIRAVGRAYAAAKEFERAMQVVSGTCDAYFLQEANLPGALEDLGRVRASTDRMKALLLDHPDTALNREMRLGLGTRLASAARTAEDVARDPRAMSKAELLAEAAAALERFLAWHPEDPAGDRASLTLGSVHLEAGNYARAEKTSRAAAARYPKSRFVDGFDYTTAFALFARRSFADALAMCERLETFDYGAHANPGPAVMRERAILMKAQIHHAKGELDKALENYKKVRETAPDAARSVAFLEREAISVPETTPAPLARPAEIELEYAGVAEAHVRAYKVDLTTLALRRKELSDPAAVEVAGIRPVFEKTFKLDVPNAKRREKQKLALDLKAPGAYLVGVKAGDFFAGGLVLRGDLAMSAQEGDVLRVNLTNVATGAFVEGVKVTVVGRGGIDVLKTDLRGVAESGVDQGGSTVVAEKDGHVALLVSTGRYANVFKGQAPAPKTPQLDALQEQLKDANKQLEEDFRGNQRRVQQGVEVERTKK
ncbi:MAG TPA: tetratricopeptide repeat protein [Planctomycetota bacterium]